MNPVQVMDKECEGCKSYKPGRKSDCDIRKALYYKTLTSETFRTWAEGQVFGGYCKQRRPK